MEQVKISVIIPVYNVEQYLRECLDSVLAQTLREIEIICVNDGSTDGSLSVLNAYRDRDPRVLVIDQNNRGLSAARNSGMQHARGKYIYFIDGDDCLDARAPYALKKLFQLCEEMDLDALAFRADRFETSAQLRARPRRSTEEVLELPKVYTGVEYVREMKDKQMYRSAVWWVLWRRSLLQENSITFEEGIIYEDHLFSLQAYLAAKRVARLPDVFYHYRKRPGSITESPVTHINLYSYCVCAEQMMGLFFSRRYEPDQEREFSRAYLEMAQKVIDYYHSISDEERAKLRFRSDMERELFRQIIALDEAAGLRESLRAKEGENDSLRNSLAALRQEAEALRSETAAIRMSPSYRLGCAVTWLPRKVRGGVRCWKENGLRYTVRRFFEHLSGKA